jgi:DNA (cytosine-5)-methyltransferase 1
MTHGSLFSGIGGFDLAAEWMGWENKFHCEWNEFGQKVLKYYWPNAELFTDITKSDFTKYANQIDVLTGGFPCQPYSVAGKRLGKEDERHLWPEMLRVIREVNPTWVVGENVRGLVSWNGGLVFHEVQTDLENQGYEVQSFLIPAASVNAPHRRDRVWFVAYSKSFGDRRTTMQQSNPYKQGWSSETDKEIWNKGEQQLVCNSSIQGDATDTTSIGFSAEMENRKLERRERFTFCNQRNKWDSFPSVSPLCNGDDGLSDRLDSITFSKWRKESLKAGGNAIVPQVVYQIFKAIEQYETL